ncbi:multicopper oxidase family protein [Oryzobacter telluris]|uniref:multicopper oxidase family protein n=1 Tax=Oryzobacter telluris TaxID=3149179 RepID=UPI00370D1D13
MRTARRLAGPVAAVVLVAAVATWWGSSLLPGSYAVTSMGVADPGRPEADAAVLARLRAAEHGTRGHGAHAGAAATVPVDRLRTDRAATPDVRVDLAAGEGRVVLADGREVRGYTVNGTSPGPTVEAEAGQLVEVVLRNVDVEGGVTLHWHGMDVPNAEDGVAGVTQDAVRPGGTHTYRWRMPTGGTYWYHSHQVSHDQVVGGLLGAVVVRQAVPTTDVDTVALVHTYAGRRTIGGRSGDTRLDLAPGRTARIRLVNTDNGATTAWVDGGRYRVLAVDGTDLNGPTPVEGRGVEVAAGGRVDLEVTAPADGSALRVSLPGAGVVVGPVGSAAPAPTRPPVDRVDLLRYGSPEALGALGGAPDRVFEYAIGRRFGIVDGRPGGQWTVNGRLFPDVPMFMVTTGDVVRMRISNNSGEVHPMHLHGHHVVVLSRDGVASTGSPWVVDSLTVEDGHRYEVAFVADNPGIWTDHCHNLPHAAEGLMAHLMYEGVTTPYRLGRDTANHPD